MRHMKTFWVIILFAATLGICSSYDNYKFSYDRAMFCSYDKIKDRYCFGSEEYEMKYGKIEVDIDYNSEKMELNVENVNYKLSIISVKVAENNTGDSVVHFRAERNNLEFFVTIGPDYLNIGANRLWKKCYLFDKATSKKKNRLTDFHIGKKRYIIRSIAYCKQNKKTRAWDDACEFSEGNNKPYFFETKVSAGKLYLHLDTTNILRIISADTITNSSNDLAVLYIGYDIHNYADTTIVTLSHSYANIISGDVKLEISEEELPDELKQKKTVTASAVAVAPNILITNTHVSEGLSRIGLYLDGENIPTNGYTRISELDQNVFDFAIIQVNGAKLNSCPLSTESPKLGEDIYVWGYPNIESQGADLKVTKGIVSGRTGYRGDKNSFQIDAAIQPGNSGGPIVHNKKIVGLVTSYLIDSQNVNFGIKASKIQHVLRFYDIQPKATTTDFSKCTYMIYGE